MWIKVKNKKAEDKENVNKQGGGKTKQKDQRSPYDYSPWSSTC